MGRLPGASPGWGPPCWFFRFTRGVPGLASSALCSQLIFLRPGSLRIFLAGKGRMSQNGGSPLPPAEGVRFTLWVAAPREVGGLPQGHQAGCPRQLSKIGGVSPRVKPSGGPAPSSDPACLLVRGDAQGQGSTCKVDLGWAERAGREAFPGGPVGGRWGTCCWRGGSRVRPGLGSTCSCPQRLASISPPWSSWSPPIEGPLSDRPGLTWSSNGPSL